MPCGMRHSCSEPVQPHSNLSNVLNINESTSKMNTCKNNPLTGAAGLKKDFKNKKNENSNVVRGTSLALHYLSDQAVKNSAGCLQEVIPIPCRDWIPNIKRRMYELWEVSWREEGRDFYLLKPKTGYWSEDTRKRMRRDEVVINWLRLGHTQLTHGFMFDPELQRA